MRALKTIGLSLLAACLASSGLAQGPPEKPKVVLGVGGKPALYYLPLTIAERKGFFKEEGLEVEINDFAGGARALQALVGGSVDVVTGAYEHTVRMQAKGQDIRGVAELGRFPLITVAVRKEHAAPIKSAADFKGRKIGVTAPGSSTHLIPLYAMSKAGLKAADAAFVGVGATASAVAAVQRGEIDIISNTEPVISKLEQEGAIVPLIDTRTEAGTRALFGGSNPAATLYARAEFIEKNPETTQRLVNALLKALKWLRGATPEEVAEAVPPEYHLGDKGLYVAALRKSLDAYSRDGLVSPEGMKSVLDMLKTLDPEIQNAAVDLAKTFDDRFVRRSPVK
ncbi:MAG: PhnD/SsuA/transferrin family substrate-binding protein [Microvirga sp.]|jgi:NitT/TauT family transport system substrate-binding protein|nr:PhnD/SsuA/transferrin family substrate-binding protein [Microvirga sp.]